MVGRGWSMCCCSVAVRPGIDCPPPVARRSRAVDEAQYADDSGPCLDALHGGDPVAVDICATMSWPGFREAAERMGLKASLSIPLFAGSGTTIAALNLYSHDLPAMLALDAWVITIYHTDARCRPPRSGLHSSARHAGDDGQGVARCRRPAVPGRRTAHGARRPGPRCPSAARVCPRPRSSGAVSNHRGAGQPARDSVSSTVRRSLSRSSTGPDGGAVMVVSSSGVCSAGVRLFRARRRWSRRCVWRRVAPGRASARRGPSQASRRSR